MVGQDLLVIILDQGKQFLFSGGQHHHNKNARLDSLVLPGMEISGQLLGTRDEFFWIAICPLESYERGGIVQKLKSIPLESVLDPIQEEALKLSQRHLVQEDGLVSPMMHHVEDEFIDAERRLFEIGKELRQVLLY